MTYLKRLWNAIVVFLAFIMGFICTPLILIEATVVTFVYYIVTGKCYVAEYKPAAYYVVSWLLDTLTFKND